MSIHYQLLRQLFPPEKGQKRFHPQFRLEGTSHDPDSREGLAMPIADPLWMLAKQWQLGELLAEDNGSPAAVRIHHYQRKVNRLRDRRNGSFRADPVDIPLEYLVESVVESEPNVRQRALAGNRLVRLIQRRHPTSAAEMITLLRNRYPLQQKPDEPSDQATEAFIAPLLGRVPDGWAAWRAAEEDLPERATISAALDGLRSLDETYLPSLPRRDLEQPIPEPSILFGHRIRTPRNPYRSGLSLRRS